MEKNISAEKMKALEIQYERLLESAIEKAREAEEAIAMLREHRQESRQWPHGGKYAEETLGVSMNSVIYELKAFLQTAEKIENAIER